MSRSPVATSKKEAMRRFLVKLPRNRWVTKVKLAKDFKLAKQSVHVYMQEFEVSLNLKSRLEIVEGYHQRIFWKP